MSWDALAAVAVTSTAFAQNVTISGRLDVGTISYKDSSSEAGTAREQIKGSTLAGERGNASASRLTFSGTEDLGGGLSSFFSIETGLGGGLGSRNQFLGLRGNFGSVQLGNYTNQLGVMRVLGTASLADSRVGGDFLGAHSTTSGVWGDREDVARVLGLNNPTALVTNSDVAAFSTSSSARAADARNNLRQVNTVIALMSTEIGNGSRNSIQYTTPKIGDFTFTVATHNNKLDESDRGVLTDQDKTSGHMLSGRYQAGALDVHMVHATAKRTLRLSAIDAVAVFAAGATDAIGDSSFKAKTTALRVAYDFGVVNAYVMNERKKGTVNQFNGNSPAGNTGVKSGATEVGVVYPMGAFNPFLTVGRGKMDADVNGAANARLKTSSYQLGTTYDLSKRTQLYAATGRFNLKESAGAVAGGADYKQKSTGYTLGMLHFF